jgi:hypothetical protein
MISTVAHANRERVDEFPKETRHSGRDEPPALAICHGFILLQRGPKVRTKPRLGCQVSHKSGTTRSGRT